MKKIIATVICFAVVLSSFAKELSLAEKRIIVQKIDATYAKAAQDSGMTVAECFGLGEAVKVVNMNNDTDLLTVLTCIDAVEKVAAFASLESDNPNSVSVKAFSSLGIDVNEMVKARRVDQFMTVVQQLHFLAQSGNYNLAKDFLKLLNDTMNARGMDYVVCFNRLSHNTNDFVKEYYTYRNGYLVFWADINGIDLDSL